RGSRPRDQGARGPGEVRPARESHGALRGVSVYARYRSDLRARGALSGPDPGIPPLGRLRRTARVPAREPLHAVRAPRDVLRDPAPAPVRRRPGGHPADPRLGTDGASRRLGPRGREGRKAMVPIDLTGRQAVVMGVANHRSLAWGIAEALAWAGARLCLTHAGERLTAGVRALAASLPPPALVLECDVTQEPQLAALAERLGREFGSVEALVHGIAFARREDLSGRFVDTPLEGFRTVVEVSAASLVRITHHLLPLLEKNGAGVVTLSYLAAERAVPNYNVMGTAK